MRKRLVVLIGLAGLAAVLIVIVPRARAAVPYTPEIEAWQQCKVNEDGERVYTLYYAMQAWNQEGLNPDERINLQISLRVSDQPTDDEIVMEWSAGMFIPQNHYRFKGSYELDVNEPHTLLLRARSEERWGAVPKDEDSPPFEEGQARYLTVAPPAGCPGTSPLSTNRDSGLPPGEIWTGNQPTPTTYTPGFHYDILTARKGIIIHPYDEITGDGRAMPYPVDRVEIDSNGHAKYSENIDIFGITGVAPPTTAPTPSTTVAPPTTTAPLPSATVAPPSTTVAPPSTTVAPPSTTVAPPSTTAPLPSTSVEVAAAAPPPSTTAPPPSTTVEFAAAASSPIPSGRNELPFTGSSGAVALIAGLSLLLVGYLALRVTRRGAAAHLHDGE